MAYEEDDSSECRREMPPPSPASGAPTPSHSAPSASALAGEPLADAVDAVCAWEAALESCERAAEWAADSHDSSERAESSESREMERPCGSHAGRSSRVIGRSCPWAVEEEVPVDEPPVEAVRTAGGVGWTAW